LLSGVVVQQSFGHDTLIGEVIGRAIEHNDNDSESPTVVTPDGVRLCLFVPAGPSGGGGKQSVVLVESHRRLCEIAALNRHMVALSPASSATSAVSSSSSMSSTLPVSVAVHAALLRHQRVRNEWACVGLARCIDCASRWLIDTPEATAFLDSAARMLQREAGKSLVQRRSTASKVMEKARVPAIARISPARISSSPVLRANATLREVDGGRVYDSNQDTDDKAASVDHASIATPLSVRVLTCELIADASKRLDSMGRVEMCVTASVLYGGTVLAEVRSTSAVAPVKFDSRCSVTWKETLQLDVLIATLPREASLDLRLCTVGVMASTM
jgi:hypothetical protein